jgi:hypothetical protein
VEFVRIFLLQQVVGGRAVSMFDVLDGLLLFLQLFLCSRLHHIPLKQQSELFYVT